MKQVFILRALPGSGKTQLADFLKAHLNTTTAICSSDDFLINENQEYEWTEERVYVAHKKCMEKYCTELKNGTDLIVVSNTNIHNKDVKEYKQIAEEYNYIVVVLYLEKWHDGVNSHNVEELKIAGMAKILKENLSIQLDEVSKILPKIPKQRPPKIKTERTHYSKEEYFESLLNKEELSLGEIKFIENYGKDSNRR